MSAMTAARIGGTEAVAQNTMLSDSVWRTRPHFSTYLTTDVNAGANTVEQIEHNRRQRHMKFPKLSGRGDVDSFQKPGNTAFIKFNDIGDHRSTAPLRSFDNIVDPVSGFVAVAAELDRNTGRLKMAPMGQIPDTPQTSTPQTTNSIRKNMTAAPRETQRLTVSEPGPPSTWNSRSVSDASIRASLGGWTSDVDPRKAEKEKNSKPKTADTQWRDNLALKYSYTPSTQRAYEEVPWDNVLPPKQWPATSTLEERPDMISQRFATKRYDSEANKWQGIGRSWDWFQTRKGHYKHGPNQIVFCSPCPRQKQIPLYGGCVGGENLDEIDNAAERFQPLTVKRVDLPRFTDTAHRPNIPKYTGCTLYQRQYSPAHSKTATPEPQTTARVHRSLPDATNVTQEFKRDSQMSKMVTTVPPNNPFNKKPTHTVTVMGPV
ncbi:unnamed protein product [Owenia fusiformis]|uniref:Uncharacterized protein n=1 Tax=Owenia fusiformis TaxID=6347 RepID=A0A8J1UID5_OWEFU|nr:unnamed protein product [Owenia fusiformis]